MPRILYQILTEPVLPPALQPEQVTESRWHQPLSEPVRRGGLITAVVAATTIVGPSFVPNPVPPPSVDGWHGQISQPTLRKGPTGAAQAASVAFIGSDAATDARWLAPLSEPVRVKRAVEYPAFSFAYFTAAAAEVVTVDKYYNWLSEPVRRNVFHVYDQQALAFTPQSIFGSGDVAFASTNTIVPFQRTMLYPAVQGPVPLNAAETVTVDKYYNCLAEPVRFPRALAAYQQPYFSLVKAAPFAETVSVDRWLQAFSAPVLRRSQSQQAASFFVGSDTATDARWLAPLSDPTRRKPTIQSDALTWSYFTPAVGEVVTVDKYYKWLSEPVRGRGFPVYDQQALAFTPQPISGSGDVAFASTNTIVPYLRVLLYPAVQGPVSLAIASGEVVTVDKYYNWLSEPVRLPRALVACLRPYLSFVQAAPFPETVSIDRWLQQLSQPTLRLVSVAGQPFAAWSAFTPQPVVVLAREWIIKARRRGRR